MTIHEASPCREEDIEETEIKFDEKIGVTTYKGYIQTFETQEQFGGNYSMIETRWGDGFIRNFVRPNLIDIPIGRKVILKTHIEISEDIEAEESIDGVKDAKIEEEKWRVIDSAELYKKR